MSDDPRDCPHGIQYRKRMHLCAACMEPEIDSLRAELANFVGMLARWARVGAITGGDYGLWSETCRALDKWTARLRSKGTP